MDFQKPQPVCLRERLVELIHNHDDNERQKLVQVHLKKDRAYVDFLKTNVWEKIFLEAAAKGYSGIHILGTTTNRWDKQSHRTTDSAH